MIVYVVKNGEIKGSFSIKKACKGLLNHVSMKNTNCIIELNETDNITVRFYDTERLHVLRKIVSTDIVYDVSTDENKCFFKDLIKLSEKDLVEKHFAGNLERANKFFENTYVYDYMNTDTTCVAIEHGYSYIDSDEVFVSKIQENGEYKKIVSVFTDCIHIDDDTLPVELIVND